MRSLISLGRAVRVEGSRTFGPTLGRARACRLTVVLGVVGCGALVFLGSAFAGLTRFPAGSFGSFSNPQGVAVDRATGDVYVVDSANNRVEKFDSQGNLLLGFGADVGGVGVNTCTLVCGVGTRGSAPGQFSEARFVAVDESGGPSSGDVYVADTADNLVSKFDSSGNLVGSWGAGGQLNGSTATHGPFGSLAGIAVDANGQLRAVNTNSQEFVFAQDGTFSNDFTLERGTAANGVGVSAAGRLFKVNGDGSLEEFDLAGADIGTVTIDAKLATDPPGPATNAFAVDPLTGDVYVASLTVSSARLDHYAFNGTGEVIEPGGATCAVKWESKGCEPSDSVSLPFTGSGIAVASTGDTYVSNPATGQVEVYGPVVLVPDVVGGSVTGRRPTSAQLSGTVNPDGVALVECRFEYGSQESYGQSVPCSQTPAQIGSGSIPVAVSAEVSGLTAGATYHFRLVAANANGPEHGKDETFTTATLPAIDGAGPANVNLGSADLTAKINPDNGETTYHFEYGTSTSYGTSVPIPDANIGEGSGDVPVIQHLDGLQENTTYHFRVVAQNTAGTVTSPDHMFVYDTSGLGLPDGRAYEMVSPPHKNAALIEELLNGLPTDFSEDGSRVISTTVQCFADSGSCTAARGAVGASYAFSRTPDGWVTNALAPSAKQFEISQQHLYRADAGTELFTIPNASSGEEDWYARGSDGSFVEIGPVTPPASGALGPEPSRIEATADLSHVAYVTSPPTWPFDATTGSPSAYEYSGSGNTAPMLVGVSGGKDSISLISKCGTELPTIDGQDSLSGDGRTVFFYAEPCPPGANEGVEVPSQTLYARVDGELPDAHTVAISQRSPADCGVTCQSSPPRDALFQGASRDGSKVFFTSTQQLTDNASEDSDPKDDATRGGSCFLTNPANSGCNLYLYDFANRAGHNLLAVSAGDTSGLGPQVQGVMASSEDGSHVYFVANGVLASGASPGDCRRGEEEGNTSGIVGTCNLYVFERDAGHPGGHVAFIAALPGSDANQWNEGISGIQSWANVTPDGRFLVFMSHGALTPDVTRRDGVRQVFRYDAQRGELVRISIGEHGFNDNGNGGSGNAIIVGRAPILLAGPTRTDPTMSHDGSYVFFMSPVALTRGALSSVPITSIERNGVIIPVYAENVYEYHDGHVYLISDGRDSSITDYTSANSRTGMCLYSSVCLIGSDSTGTNVFFETADQLVPGDIDTGTDIYDARICRTGDPCIKAAPRSLPPCLGEACHGTPAGTPLLPSAPTSTFNGQGNVTTSVSPATKGVAKKRTRCVKGRVRSHGKCVKARRQKKAKRAKAHRGGK